MTRGGARIAGPGKKIGRPNGAVKRNALLTVELADAQLKKRLGTWGITPEDFHSLLREQKGRCPVCAQLLNEWCVDHDHVIMKIRGLIHRGCNNLLGLAKDDPVRLEMAAAYIRKHNKLL